MALLQILVASYLPSHVAPTGLRQSMRAARERAESLGLAGGLLFDGEKFVQLFIGPEDAACQAVAALQRDATHERLHSLDTVDGLPDPAWRDWQVGYTEPAVLDSVLAAAARGQALQAFAQVMRAVDLT